MIELISNDLNDLSFLDNLVSSDLPRILFINVQHLGWRTNTKNLIAATSKQKNLLAVHLNLNRPVWLRVLGKNYLPRGLDHHQLRAFWLGQIWLMNGLQKIAASGKFQMIHIMSHHSALPLVRLKANYPQLKVACMLDVTAPLEKLAFKRLSMLAAMMPYEQRIFQSCDLISSWSRWAAKSVIEDYNIPKEKVMVGRPPCLPPCNKIDHHTKSDLLNAIFIGNDWKRKGGPRLLKLHQKYWSKQIKLHVVSAKAPKVEATNVQGHGYVPHDSLIQDLLPKMDFMVHMTSEDCLPLVLLEASSLGVPSVTVNLAGIPEIVLDGITGLLVPSGDWSAFRVAVERMISDEPMRLRMGKSAQQHVQKNFDFETNYGNLVNRMIELCSSNSR